jgi:hypothetical protein
VKFKLVKKFPKTWDQLWASITAVFDSWMNPRAIYYRRMNQFSDAWGTTVMYKQWCMVIWGRTLVLVWHLQRLNWRKYFQWRIFSKEDVVSLGLGRHNKLL